MLENKELEVGLNLPIYIYFKRIWSSHLFTVVTPVLYGCQSYHVHVP